MSRLERWKVEGTTLKRRGRPDKVGGYNEFAPGTVRPNGIDDPGANNVGPRTTLTTWDGDYVLSTPDQVVSGLDIRGRLYVTSTALNCIVRDCIIRGPDKATSDNAIVLGDSLNLRNITIEWSRLDGEGRESVWTEGIRGGNWTIRYSEIRRVVDGLSMVTLGNGVAECVRVSNGVYGAWLDSSTGTPYPNMPSQGDRTTHSDACQIHQYTGWVIRGCYLGGEATGYSVNEKLANRDPQVPAQKAVIDQIDAATDYNNACVQIGVATPGLGALIENNWFSGGGARINLATKASAGDTLGGVTLRNNRFIRSTWANPGYYIFTRPDFSGVMENNVFDDTGLPVPISINNTVG